MNNRYRLYDLEAFTGPRYAVTEDADVLLQTENWDEAAVLYANLRGIAVAEVRRATHSAEVEYEIAERVICGA
jgi:hypothetical protein